MVTETIKPFDPDCKRTPDEISEYANNGEGMTADEFVMREEGTYNCENGHFLCTDCYIKRGMPSSPRGWVCP